MYVHFIVNPLRIPVVTIEKTMSTKVILKMKIKIYIFNNFNFLINKLTILNPLFCIFILWIIFFVGFCERKIEYYDPL